MMKDVTDARRLVIVEVVRQNPGITGAELLDALVELHHDGEWPQASWASARNDPYSVGLRQHLEALVKWDNGILRLPNQCYFHWDHSDKKARQITGGGKGAFCKFSMSEPLKLGPKAPDGPSPLPEDELRQRAAAILDAVTDDVRSRLVRWQRRQGRRILLGVEANQRLRRVIVMDTGRGEVRFPVKQNQSWEDALEEVGV